MRKVGSLAAIAVFAILGVATLNAPHAAADGVDGPYIDQAFVGRIQDYDSKGVIMSCLLQSDDNRPSLTSTQVQGGYWFGSISKYVPVSYYTDSSDGLFGCNSSDDVNGSRLKSMLTGMGWSTPIQAACSLGAKAYYASIGSDQMTGELYEQGAVDMKCGDAPPEGKTAMFILPNRNTTIDTNKNAREALSDLINSQKKYTIEITPELRYVAAWEAFRMGCKAKTGAGSGAIIMKDMTSATDINNNLVDIAGTVAVRVVSKEGIVDIVRFKVPDLGQRIGILLLNPENGDAIVSSCQEIADDMNGVNHANYMKAVMGLEVKTPYNASEEGGGTEEGESKSSCTVEGVGWIVCPVMTFLAGINDGLYGFLANFLDIDPTIFANNTTGGLYGAWNTFRSYANILFIIAFLIIVYSQITSVGITNYGVKKLLPKLIVAAILVNTSYYICQIAVDISNILGYGLKSLFDAIGGGLITSGDELSWLSIVGAGLAAVGVAVGVIALMLAISVPVVLAGLLSLLMVAVILIARQSIIILLIAVSPLAFVAWLLPNTEKWFKKWWEIFFSMLMLFPIISALFGAGALAGRILATGDFGDDGGAAKIAALGATVLPLILTIPLLQNSLKATGALGAKLSGWSQKANSRVGSKVKSDSKLGRGWSAAMSYRSQKRANKQTEAIATKKAYRNLAGVAGGKGYAGTLINRAKEAADKEHAEAVSRATSGFTGMKDDDILDVAQDTKRSAAERQAAISHLLQKGKHDHKVAALKASGTLGDDEDGKRARGAVSDEYARSDISSLYGKEVAGSIRTGSSEDGEIDMDGALRGNFGNVSAQTLANKNYAKSVAEAYAGADPAQQKKIDQAIDKIHSTPQIAGAITADTEAELMRIPHYAVAKAAAASGTNTPTTSNATTPPSTSGTGGSGGGGSGGTSGGSGSPSGGAGTTAPTSTPGPLPGGGTTNLFNSGVAALPHSSSLVAPPSAVQAASTSSSSNLNNLENMSQVGDHEAPPTPRPSAPSDSDDDMDGVVPI